MPTQPPKDPEDQGDKIDDQGDKTEDDVSTTKTQESSMADAEVGALPNPNFLTTYLINQDPVTLHNLGQAHEARFWSTPINIFWDWHQ